MYRRLFYILILLFPLSARTQFNIVSSDFMHLDADIDSILTAFNVPGAQLAIVNRDSIVWKGNYGYADWKNKRPVTDETMFRIGSITKSFVAVSVMMLEEKGFLKLDDEIKELAPELPFFNRWEKTDPVRLVHLLEHTAGFDDMHLTEYAANGENWSTLEGLQYHPHSKISRWRPGRHMSYCNSGPPMAAYIVEKKTGKCIEDFIAENIFQPLGMYTSTFRQTQTVRQQLAKGYSGSHQAEMPYWHIINRSAGAIHSTATEMSRYIRLFLNRGQVDDLRLLSPSSIIRIETPTSTLAAKAGVKDGYGLYIQTQRYNDMLLCGHGGGMPGFLANMQYFPELGIGYVLFINKSDGLAMNAINRAILTTISPTDEQTIKEAYHPSDRSLIGYYRTATSRNELFRFLEWPTHILRIKEIEGRLYLKPLLGQERPLEKIGRYHFRLQFGQGFSSPVVFAQDETGKRYLQIPNAFGNYYPTPAFAVWIPFYIFNISSLLMLSAVLWAFFWIPRLIVDRYKFRNTSARLWSLLAAVSIQGFMLLLNIGSSTDAISQLGQLTPVSCFIYIFSLLSPVFSVISFFVCIRSLETNMHLFAYIHSLLVAMACLCISAYFGYWGLWGLKIWTF